MTETPEGLIALTVRDTPEGEPRAVYVERAELAKLVGELVGAELGRSLALGVTLTPKDMARLQTISDTLRGAAGIGPKPPDGVDKDT